MPPAGYSPTSLKNAHIDGLMGESWAMGSLAGALQVLLRSGAIGVRDVLMLNDVPNCDIPSAARVCVR
jgi:hypothetical protein